MARARKRLVTLLTKVPFPTRNHPFANPQTVLNVRSVDPVFRCYADGLQLKLSIEFLLSHGYTSSE